mmetsp:Transcript_33789/g.46312  ORF Transcript_33789/g.46312 Transcript_33789/m.46312 type:complete len:114 (+) Transcript_33789:1976-2317(+)
MYILFRKSDVTTKNGFVDTLYTCTSKMKTQREYKPDWNDTLRWKERKTTIVEFESKRQRYTRVVGKLDVDMAAVPNICGGQFQQMWPYRAPNRNSLLRTTARANDTAESACGP